MVLSGAEGGSERNQGSRRVLEGRRGRGLSKPQRLLPQRPLPNHSPYLPGRGERPGEPSFDNLSTPDVFAFGVDLFHAGYYWEAHQAWEHAWHQLDDGSPFEGVVRASIRTTAAHVKQRQGNERGVASHRRGAQGHLEGLPAILELADLRIDVALFRERLDGTALPRAIPVARLVKTAETETETDPRFANGPLPPQHAATSTGSASGSPHEEFS